MRVDERKTAMAAAVLSAAGILLLFFMAETPTKASVAEAIVAAPNSLLEISGIAANVSSDKFQLCDRVCITVKSMELPAARLLGEGNNAAVLGRVKEYMGRRYVEAEKIVAE